MLLAYWPQQRKLRQSDQSSSSACLLFHYPVRFGHCFWHYAQLQQRLNLSSQRVDCRPKFSLARQLVHLQVFSCSDLECLRRDRLLLSMGLHSNINNNNNMILNRNVTQSGGNIPPFHVSLPGSRDAVVSLMTEEQLSATFRLIQEAAQDGDGFGADEYKSEEEFRDDIKGGYPFIIRDVMSGKIVAATILAISRYYRGTLVADPYIIVSKDERGKGVGSFCLRLCIELAQSLGFIGMYVDTFANNTAMIRIIEGVPGFTRVGRLPIGGKLKNGQMVETVIYYKDLRDK